MEAVPSRSLVTLLSDHPEGRIEPLQAAQTTLLAAEAALVELVLAERLPCVIVRSARDVPPRSTDAQRLTMPAELVERIYSFGGDARPHESDPRQVHVQLPAGHPLRDEWFVFLLSARFAAVLCAQDQAAAESAAGERSRALIWRCEPAVVADALAEVRALVARIRPDQAPAFDAAIRRFPPPAPDAGLVSRFSMALLAALSRQHQLSLRLERTLVHDARLRALGQVLAGAAHELHAPVRSILGFASLLAEDLRLDPETGVEVQQIISAARRAQHVLTSLLQLARPMPNRFVPTDLARLTGDTLALFRADLATHGIQLAFDSDAALPPARANPALIQQLLINLLSNAVQALAHHQQPRRILVQVQSSHPESLRLVVADNGPGIPPELQARVFEPFVTTRSLGEGAGLGLSIVRSIVKEHQGAISLEARAEGGTLVAVTLPATAGAQFPSPVLAPERGRILVIDDDQEVNALIERTLTRAGYSVHTEFSPGAALKRLTDESFDAIVCDLLLPEMSGIELYERIARLKPELAERLIFITGDATRPMTRVFLQGADLPYLLKPFNPGQLIAVVVKVLGAE